MLSEKIHNSFLLAFPLFTAWEKYLPNLPSETQPCFSKLNTSVNVIIGFVYLGTIIYSKSAGSSQNLWKARESVRLADYVIMTITQTTQRRLLNLWCHWTDTVFDINTTTCTGDTGDQTSAYLLLLLLLLGVSSTAMLIKRRIPHAPASSPTHSQNDVFYRWVWLTKAICLNCNGASEMQVCLQLGEAKFIMWEIL